MRAYTLLILQDYELSLKSKINKNKKNPKNRIRNEQKYNVIIRIRKQNKKLLKTYDFHYDFYIVYINLLRANVQSGRNLKAPFETIRRNVEERSHRTSKSIKAIKIGES